MLREKRAAYAQKLVEEERYEKAVSLYNRMVADDPTDIAALRNLGDLHLRLSRHAKALSAYERIAEHHYRVANYPESAGVYEQIWMIIARHAPELRPGYAHVTGRLVQVLEGVADTDQALRLVDRLLAAHHDAELARWAASNHLVRGTRVGAAAALALLRKCFSGPSVDIVATSLLVQAFDQVGQPEKGTVVLRETARMAWRAGDRAVYDAIVDALAVRSLEDTVVDVESRRDLLRSEITAVDLEDTSVTHASVSVFDGSPLDGPPTDRPPDTDLTDPEGLSAEEPLPLLRRVEPKPGTTLDGDD